MSKLIVHDEQWYKRKFLKNYGIYPTSAQLETFRQHYSIYMTRVECRDRGWFNGGFFIDESKKTWHQ